MKYFTRKFYILLLILWLLLICLPATLLRKKYEYEDIRKVEICRGSIYHWPCIRIYVKSHTKPYFHSLDCMSQDSIPEFLAELGEHGVDAESTVKSQK